MNLSANGSFVYTPNNLFVGPDSFTYTVRDPHGAVSNTAVVTITVQAVPQAPVSVNDSYTTPENTILTKSAAAGLLANDTDADTAASNSHGYTDAHSGRAHSDSDAPAGHAHEDADADSDEYADRHLPGGPEPGVPHHGPPG